MDNMQRIRVFNILRDMESVIHNDVNLSKHQTLNLMSAIDRLWDELKGDNAIEEKVLRATATFAALPLLHDHSLKLREQLLQV